MARWGEFELLEELGRGAFGAVYRSFHPVLQQEVALKLIPVPTHDPRAVEKALEEARRLASVRHNHVVVVHDARAIDGYVGICMEYVRGQSLEAIVSERGPYDPDEATGCIRALAGALSAVHRAHIVHNDVKARNVIRETGGRIVLMDFGAGRRLADPNASTGLTLVGTPLYMAPELFRLRDATPASDIYSLGVLWFFLLTGEFPVTGETLQQLAESHAQGKRRFLADFRDDVPDRVLRTIGLALEPDPALRYQTSGALIDDLNGHAHHVTAVDASPAPVPWRREEDRRRRPRTRAWLTSEMVMPALAVLAGIVLGIGAIGFLAARAYAVMFGLEGEFARESPRVWFEGGMRTLPLVIYAVALVQILWAVGSLVWRVTRRTSTVIDTWSKRTSQKVVGVTERTGLNDARSMSTLLLIAQCSVLLLTAFLFQDVIQAFTTPIVEHVLPEHALLSIDHNSQWLQFRMAMCVVTVAGGYAWWAVLRRWPAKDIGFARTAGGLCLVAASLALGTVPWRIVNDASFDQATFGSEACFILAERGERLQLFCPDDAEKVRFVPAADSRLVRPGTKVNLFSAVAGRRQ